MTEINTEPIKNRLTKITSIYDPEWDVIYGAPPLLWASNELAEICLILVKQVDILQERIKEIENDLDAANIPHMQG